ncbi:hypothetical protein IU501_15070 [Nocardia otitidiscaviarum]|uniref:hypothetical protein n=1 Tax=Nocardia otitidiscaviarum TaxID=1823 RepID=UPI001892FEE9|nr:hypothetical protein [Nocardia otitidiscaviarum]MBF6134317.1 hypothetical protein [Nocardia otitidiscaviarum]
MSGRPEQRVLDEIDELVTWQIEEGIRRGDAPTGIVNEVVYLPDHSDQLAAVCQEINDGLARFAPGATVKAIRVAEIGSTSHHS